jgi:hypothetical protein
MMRSYKIIILIACLLILAFPFHMTAQQPVILSGTSEDSQERNISVRILPTFVEDRKLLYLSQANASDGVYNLHFVIKKPQVLLISAVFKNWFVEFRPGDSLRFNITGTSIDKQLTFSGKDQARLNFEVITSESLTAGRLIIGNLRV